MKSINQKYLSILIVLIIILGGLAFYYSINKEKPVPITQNNNLNKVDISKWTDYSNSQLGFSIKIPLEVPTLYRCSDSKQVGNTPLGVFEDNQNGSIYISQKYYYDANWSQTEQKYIGDCSKITYSLESLKKEEKANNLAGLASHPFLGWKIIVNNPKNESELANFVKQNFGSTCTISSKDIQEDGNYEISIKGKDVGQNLMDTNCPTNFEYKILYSPEKNKLMSVILGQECTFGTTQCYDKDMINSFKFK